MEDSKLGVYICSGCGIGDAVDMEALTKVVQSEYKPAVCRVDPFLCGRKAVEGIRRDMEAEGVNTVCIAACSPRVKTEMFDFDPSEVVMDRTNLREHVAWVSEPGHEDTQMLAEDYLRMGITRTKRMGLLKPEVVETNKTVMVIGGGISGMTSALEAADAGYKVLLVEKEQQLGGFLNRLYTRFPSTPPYLEPEEPPVRELAGRVLDHGNIAVRLGTTVQQTMGQPGQLDVTLATGDKTSTVRVGSVVVATGFRPYDATRLGHLGYNDSDNVVTCEELEDHLRAGDVLLRPSDGETVKSVAFILCAGSRDPDHLPYCSTVCCRTALKQALMFRRRHPDAKVYVFYKDIRTPGHHEAFYRFAQSDPGVFLTKGEVRAVTPQTGKGIVSVELDNTLLGDRIRVDVDMVVLATGMQPATSLDDVEGGPGTLNLTYRLGAELPQKEHGFPECKFICFPYETRRTAIFAAGCVREPMDSAQAAEDATGAAMKAIQAVELMSEGRALHPRAGDLSFPDFFLQRCTQCKRCTEECPFGALDEDEKGTPLPNPNRCRRCGVCMGACPERIVSFANYSVPMIGGALKEMEVPDEEDEKPRIVVLMCENDAYPAMDMAAMNRARLSPFVRIQSVRCLGSFNMVWIADCLSAGIDGILLLGCKFGDNYQCHFIKGSELADYRLSKLEETLSRLMLEPERVKLEQVSITDFHKVPDIINSFAEEITEMDPNPYKGM